MTLLQLKIAHLYMCVWCCLYKSLWMILHWKWVSVTQSIKTRILFTANSCKCVYVKSMFLFKKEKNQRHTVSFWEFISRWKNYDYFFWTQKDANLLKFNFFYEWITLMTIWLKCVLTRLYFVSHCTKRLGVRKSYCVFRTSFMSFQ